MKAFVHHEPWSRTYELRLLEEYPGGARAAVDVDQDHHIVWAPQEERAEVPVLLRIPDRAFQAVLEELGLHKTSGDATAKHLADAVATRDRVLALVEKLT